MLTKEQIVAAKDLEVRVVDVPEWGEGAQVGVRVMTGKERDAWENSLMKNGTVSDTTDFRSRLAVMLICDSEGSRLFEDNERETVAAKSAIALQRIVDVGMTINGMTDGDVDELVKNS